MIAVSVIYTDIQKDILNVLNFSFETEFDLRQFLHDVDSQQYVTDAEHYLKIQIWVQKPLENSTLVMEKEFNNGKPINEEPKIIKEGIILQFPTKKKG